MLRLGIVRSGLPEPAVSYPIEVPQIGFTVHVDLAYPAVKLAIEYDGSYHFEVLEQFHRDIDRYYFLQQLGWTVIRVTSTHSLAWVNNEIQQFLKRRGVL